MPQNASLTDLDAFRASLLDELRAQLRADLDELRAELFPVPALVPDPEGGPRLKRSPAPPDDAGALLGYDKAAARLGISRRALERLVSNGDVRPVRLGRRAVRFHVDALDAFARRSAHAPAQTSRQVRGEVRRAA